MYTYTYIYIYIYIHIYIYIYIGGYIGLLFPESLAVQKGVDQAFYVDIV